MIPRIDAARFLAGEMAEVAAVRAAAADVGFMTIYNTPLSDGPVQDVLAAYAGFFVLPEADKRAIDMAQTGANRGWGVL